MTTAEFIGLIFLLALVALYMFIWYGLGEKDGYLEGQADALKGKIKIVMVESPTGERSWVYKNTIDDLKEGYRVVDHEQWMAKEVK